MIGISDIERAVDSATRHRLKRADVAAFMASRSDNVRMIHRHIEEGTYMSLVEYRRMRIVNKNGTVRDILSPKLMTLILQHLCRNLLMPYYEKVDVGIGFNCKPGCGITARDRRHSLLHRTKHLFYDLRQYSHLLCVDQRKCYAHIRVKTLRRALKRIGVPVWLNDFACEVCFHHGEFPIGTPTSPLAHHIIMAGYDRFLLGLGGYPLRYADNTYMAFQSSGEANRALWRIKNYWWYELGLRAKRMTAKVFNIDKTRVDVCGYPISRLRLRRGSHINRHGKGVTRVRRSTYLSALRSTPASWGSYFGIMRWADCYGAMTRIQKDMRLSELTARIRLDRPLDAKEITAKELHEQGIRFTIHDYTIRHKDGKPDWLKCLIGIECNDGKVRAYEFHGSYRSLAQYLTECEKAYPKEDMLPIEDVELDSRCGYIFRDSANMIEYF